MQSIPQGGTSNKSKATKRTCPEWNTIFNSDKVYGSLADQANCYLAKLREVQTNSKQDSATQILNESERANYWDIGISNHCHQRPIFENINKSNKFELSPNFENRYNSTEVKQETVKNYIELNKINNCSQNETLVVQNFNIKKEVNKKIVKDELISDNEDEIQTNSKDEIVIIDSEDEFQPYVKHELKLMGNVGETCENIKQAIVISDNKGDMKTNIKCEDMTNESTKIQTSAIHHETDEGNQPKANESSIYYDKTHLITKDVNKHEIITNEHDTEAVINDNDLTFHKHKTISNINVNFNDSENCLNENRGIERRRNDIILNVKNPSVRMEWEARTVYIGNLPATTKKKQLRTFFQRYGKVENITINKKHRYHPLPRYRTTVYSFIRFEKRGDTLKALEVNGMEYKKQHLKVQICKSSRNYDPEKTIFVRNIPFNVEEDDLWSKFELYGPIVSVNLLRDEFKRSKGHGFIHFEYADSVELAVKVNRVTINHCILHIARFNSKRHPV